MAGVSRKFNPEKFAESWVQAEGDPKKLAKFYKVDLRTVMRWRVQAESIMGISLEPTNPERTKRDMGDDEGIEKFGTRRLVKYIGEAPCFSDCHRWPNEPKSVAHLALNYLIEKRKPKLIMNNGDIFDGASISRHPPTGWAAMPDVADELAACQEFLDELQALAPKGSKLVWNMGNHDSRFSMRLASHAPQYVRVNGTDLPDHFPAWHCAWSTWVNNNTVFKHRFRNGVHATWNNTLYAGMNIMTAHNHRLQVTHFSDYRGPRWGGDCGTLSDFGPDMKKFTYAEDNPMNWGQGFLWLTFGNDGRLLPPEVVHVIDQVAYFRGEALPLGKRRR